MQNGADLLCETLLANDVNVCFANPGTSEMHFVAALDERPAMRCILGLFEGVVTGAADGYGRMADKPAVTLLHLGPGLANGLANLHNARRAHSPVVNVVGDHATYHLQYDAPLTSDIESLARPMSDWVKRIETIETLGRDVGQALQNASSGAGQVCTLILPANVAWGSTEKSATVVRKSGVASTPPLASALQNALQAIRAGGRTLMLLGGRALREEPLAVAARLAYYCGIDLLAETSNARIQRGRSRIALDRLPYAVDAALARLSPYKTIILVGAKEPVAFFAYPDKPSLLRGAATTVLQLASKSEDAQHALAWLADELAAPKRSPLPACAPLDRYIHQSGPLTAHAVSRLVAIHMPENTILCDESITQGRDFYRFSMGAAPHDYLQLTGGAIGVGMPMALGAAVACPDRKVITLEGDGSGMFTLQALWTQAREQANCLTIIYANQTYQILHGEMKNVGVEQLGDNARRMLNLDAPFLDWVSLAKGMGVQAYRVDTIEAFEQALKAGIALRGPCLIEAVIGAAPI